VAQRPYQALVEAAQLSRLSDQHCHPHQPDGDGVEPIYDGTAELWWDSVEEMEKSFESEIGKIAGADADEFCDIRIHIYTEEHIVIPGPREK